MASQFPPKKNTAFTLYFTLYKSDGTVIANPGTITKKVSIDGGAVADIAASVTEEDTTYGQCSLVLSAAEMNGDAIWIYIKDNTSGCVPLTCTLYTATNLMDDIKTDTTAILSDTNELQTDLANGGRLDLLIDGIKAKTDSLPAAPAATGDIPTAVAIRQEIDSNSTQLAAIVTDTNEMQTDLANGGRLDLIFDAILEDTGTTLDALVKDIPTVSEFEARTLPAADYVVETDTIAGVTTVTNLTNAPTAGDFTATMKASITAAVPTVAQIAAGVWNYLTSAMSTVGSIGKRLADWFAPYSASAAAVSTNLTICNNALMLLGNEPVDNLTDDTKSVNLCKQFYQTTVDAVLRAYPWNCAIKRSAALTATTAPNFGYDYAFTLPTDCLRVLMIEDDKAIDFKVEGKTLLTNDSTAKITYIARIDPDDMDPLLVDAISARLAATIAFPLTNSTSASTAMWQLYKDKLDEAQSTDAAEGYEPQLTNDDWINSRS